MALSRIFHYILKTLNLKHNKLLNGIFVWQHGLVNASIVIDHAFNYNSVYQLLVNENLLYDLNLHKSVESLVNQNPDFIEENIYVSSIENSIFLSLKKIEINIFKI